MMMMSRHSTSLVGCCMMMMMMMMMMMTGTMMVSSFSPSSYSRTGTTARSILQTKPALLLNKQQFYKLAMVDEKSNSESTTNEVSTEVAKPAPTSGTYYDDEVCFY